MLFQVTLAIALAVFAVGLVHNIDRWLLLDVGTGPGRTTAAARLAAGLKGALGALFSGRVVSLLRVLVVDVLFQARILKDRRDPLAWAMHLGIFWGFLLLLVMHALGSTLVRAVDPDFLSTRNPYLWLRDLGGGLLLAGLVLAVWRRIRRRGEIRTAGMDRFALVLLAVIVLSGFFLQAVQITSKTEFDRMVEDYGRGITAEETQALAAYWEAHFGLVAPDASPAAESGALALGEEVHAGSCAACHARPQAAFLSYPLSRLIRPAAGGLDRSGFGALLYHLHYLACFAGLAGLAFSRKLFHIVSTPLSLIVAGVGRPEEGAAAAAARQVIELDGCSHGGACHEACPVRRRRLARIAAAEAYAPMLDHLAGKAADELGSRKLGG
jgi:nitrate reductase gamma subunit